MSTAKERAPSCGWRAGYAGTLHKILDPTLHVKKSRDIDHTVVPSSEPATSFWICKKKLCILVVASQVACDVALAADAYVLRLASFGNKSNGLATDRNKASRDHGESDNDHQYRVLVAL